MEILREQPKSNSDESLKLAIAVALVRSKLLHKPPAAPPPPSSSAFAASSSTAPHSHSDDALKWKRKAKERKREILRLKEDLKVSEDGSHCDIFPKSASCKCYFFDKLGLLSPKRIGDGSDQRFSDVLRRRFLRQVRIKERKKRRTDDSLLHRISDEKYECCIFPQMAERDNENNVEQLSASVDFLLELCNTISPQSLEEGNFKNWCHQTVDFILGTLATMSPTERNAEPVEGIINSLIMRLLRKMCSALQGDESHHFDSAVQFYIQHLMRKVGNDAFVGQRLIFAISQRISVMAESLLFMDPFDDAFPSMHNSMYMMIQLIEFLVSDYLLTWSNTGDFDIRLFEEWVVSILHGRKALELLENRNSLYVLYIDRVIGVVAKQVGQLSYLQKLSPQILENLFSESTDLQLSFSLVNSTLLLSQYCKTSTSTDIPPSTSKPPSQTLPLVEEGQICCPKTQDINVQIKRRARFVPVTPNMGARPRSTSSSSAIGKQISSLQVYSPLFNYLLSFGFFLW